MRLLIFSFTLLLAGLAGCVRNPEPDQEDISAEERYRRDSLSKTEQRRRSDSLKKTNPLLIVPPDSTYTGEYTDRYTNGVIKFKGYFRLGQRHGQWLSFYPNGLMWSELHFDKGLREGPNSTYFENGKMRYNGFYKGDVRDSIWNYYDSTGKLSKKVVFKEDKMVKELPVNYVKK